jgi:hypothetical protein
MSDGPPSVLLSQWGFSAMHWAAQNEHEGVVAQLLRAGAAVDAADKVGPPISTERPASAGLDDRWHAVKDCLVAA